jgi:predicted AAA+ superfamily ATPase
MDYIKRDIEPILLNAAKSYSAVMITGARQVGKTTTLRRLLGEGRGFVSLDDKEKRRLAQTDPELFLATNPAPLIIDEVQYAPELFPYIKMAIDNGAPAGSYLMTGSQMYKLMRLAGESLAGRVAILKMSGLSQHEIYGSGECLPFSLGLQELQTRTQTGKPCDVVDQFERIWNGSMPAHISGKHDSRSVFYSSYIDSYIDRDIKEMVDLKDEFIFMDFIRAAACRAGQTLNIHSVAADVGVSDDTAKTWLDYLEKTGIIFYLRPFSNNLLKRTIKKTPKLYFFDTGLVAQLTGYSSPEILMNGAMNGAILENYVVSEIAKTYTNNGLDYFAHYYRDIDNKEVDLILESNGQLHPIEIKKSASPPPEITRAFKALDASSIPRGVGAVICTKYDFSAFDRDTMIVPVWTI